MLYLCCEQQHPWVYFAALRCAKLLLSKQVHWQIVRYNLGLFAPVYIWCQITFWCYHFCLLTVNCCGYFHTKIWHFAYQSGMTPKTLFQQDNRAAHEALALTLATNIEFDVNSSSRWLDWNLMRDLRDLIMFQLCFTCPGVLVLHVFVFTIGVSDMQTLVGCRTTNRTTVLLMCYMAKYIENMTYLPPYKPAIWETGLIWGCP